MKCIVGPGVRYVAVFKNIYFSNPVLRLLILAKLLKVSNPPCFLYLSGQQTMGFFFLHFCHFPLGFILESSFYEHILSNFVVLRWHKILPYCNEMSNILKKQSLNYKSVLFQYEHKSCGSVARRKFELESVKNYFRSQQGSYEANFSGKSSNL